jgi:hypothetical protein
MGETRRPRSPIQNDLIPGQTLERRSAPAPMQLGTAGFWGRSGCFGAPRQGGAGAERCYNLRRAV